MKNVSVQDNTVSAANQVTASDSVYYLGDENAPKRLLILGNSITRHGPKPDIGWENDWGMAASSPEKDYVHRLCEKLGKDYYFMVSHASEWEKNFAQENILSERFSAERDFHADITVFMLGENVKGVEDAESQNAFEKALTEFTEFLHGNTATVMKTCVWKYDEVDAVIRRVAEKKGLPLLDLNFIGADESNLAIGKFWHQGVAIHPGDVGMERIAERLAEIIRAL